MVYRLSHRFHQNQDPVPRSGREKVQRNTSVLYDKLPEIRPEMLYKRITDGLPEISSRQRRWIFGLGRGCRNVGSEID
jgi:hypothetical protein